MSFTGNKEIINKAQFDKMKLDGTAILNNMKYISKDYPSGITISTATANFNSTNASLSNFSGNYMGSDFSGNGTLNNLVSFIARNETLTGTINASVDQMDLNAWMGTTATGPSTAVNVPASGPAPAPPPAASPFLVPANMNITLNAKANKVVYDKVDYNNINGVVVLNDETVKFQNIKAAALDGTIALSGTYSTRLNKAKPDISMNYDIANMDVQKVFYAFNHAQSLMPIGKFLAGRLSSQLSMTGNLEGNMFPDLKSLTGKGSLLLLEGVLKKFTPLEKIADMLQIEQLHSISIKEIKNYIEFANGKVMVKPFTLKIDSIEMLISGFHSFDQSIDYAIQMKLPRSVLGSKGNAFVTNLASETVNHGLPFKLGSTINLSIKVNGTLSNPIIGINFKGMVDDIVKDMESQAKDFLQAKLDSMKQKTKDSLVSVQKILEQKLKDKLKDQLFGKDTTHQQNNNPVDTSKRIRVRLLRIH